MKKLAAAVAVALSLAALLAPNAQADHGPHEPRDLPAEEDNGAEGRAGFGGGGDVPPKTACNQPGRVVRVLPDGPRQPNGDLAFTSGLCVYLPPGYATSGLEYPVLYLLHGGGGDAGDWFSQGKVADIMDAAAKANPKNAAIVVTPDGTDAQWYDSIDGTLRNEEYVLDHVIPYVDARFRTIASRRGRMIDGLSNGGYGAMHLAAKAPDTFVVAGAMSANLGGRSFGGFGSAVDDPAYGPGQTPANLVPNLDGIDLTLDIGASCSSDATKDLCATFAFEQLFLPDNKYFVGRLEAEREGHPERGIWEYRETEGGHSWRWWPKWLQQRHLPFLLARTADPRPATTTPEPADPPKTFRYRSIAERFSVWGYDVRVDRDVREFLDLTVTKTAVTATGSGTATVTTAARYEPNRTYLVGGKRTKADKSGRLTFTIDLGPSHQYEERSPQADALEAAGGYWTTRTVTIRRARA